MRLHKEGWMYCVVATVLFGILGWLVANFLGEYPIIAYPLYLVFFLIMVLGILVFSYPSSQQDGGRRFGHCTLRW